MDQTGSRSPETHRILSWLCETREPSQAEALSAPPTRAYPQSSGEGPSLPPPERPIAMRLAGFRP